MRLTEVIFTAKGLRLNLVRPGGRPFTITIRRSHVNAAIAAGRATR